MVTVKAFRCSIKELIFLLLIILSAANSHIWAAEPLSDQQLACLYGGVGPFYKDYYCGLGTTQGCPPETPCQGSNGNCLFCVPQNNEYCDWEWSSVNDPTCTTTEIGCEQQSINPHLENGPQGYCNIGECVSFPRQPQESYPECSSMQYIKCTD